MYRHIIDGYHYTMEKGRNEVAKITMTHSYPIKDEEFYFDVKFKEEYFIREYIRACQYDLLIQLCDSLALSEGCCILEKRFVDVARRYGVGDTTVRCWNKLFRIKEYFEKRMCKNIYDVITGVKEVIFMDINLWTSSVKESVLFSDVYKRMHTVL